jgi:hypothetical protein
MRRFALSPPGNAYGVSCGAHGAFIDSVPLLKRARVKGEDVWEPRDSDELSAELSARYGLPIDIAAKANGLTVVARALNAGAVARAQMATLFLNLPQPPLAKNATRDDLITFIRELHAGGLIKANWKPDQHPRWPIGSPDSQGGRFSPKGTGTSEPGIGHNQGPPLEPEPEPIPVAGEAVAGLAEVGALATGILAVSTTPLDSGEDEAIDRINQHHSWPKYLGGDPAQPLSTLSEDLHVQYHAGLQSEIAPQCHGKAYYDALSLEERVNLFRKVIDYTKQFDTEHGTTLYRDMLRNGFPESK